MWSKPPLFGQNQWSKPPLFEVKNRLLKTAHFVEKAYLNPITISKSAIFDVFADFGHFWHPLRDTTGAPLVFWFSWYKTPIQSSWKSAKWPKHVFFMKNHEKHQFSQFSSKCHRQTWYLENALFRPFFVKFRHFFDFSMGFGLGFWHVLSARSCRRVKTRYFPFWPENNLNLA